MQVTRHNSPGPFASKDEAAEGAAGGADSRLIAAQEENLALKAELERYRLAALASRESLWELDIATGDIWYSPQILEMLGWEGHERGSPQGLIVSSDDWIAEVHPEDLGFAMEAIKAHIKHHAAYDLEYRFRRPSGEYRWLRMTGQAIRDETNFATRMVGVVSDVTERKLAEQALRESQAESEAARSYLTNALQSMRDGFGIWDADERLVIFNESFRTLAGEAADFYRVGVAFEDVIRQGAEIGQWYLGEGGVEGFVAERLASFRAGETYELRRSDGTWMEALDHKAEGGQTISCRIDITARKHTEEALRRNEANLKAAQQISTIGNWEISDDEDAGEWSDEVYRIFGRDKDAFGASYNRFLECAHPDDREMVKSEIAQGMAAGVAFSFRHRIVRPGGEVRHVLERAVPRWAKDGTVIGGAGTVQDITEQTELDEALRHSEHRLREAQRISSIGDWESVGASRKRRWSDEIYQILGRDPETYASSYDNFLACIHPDDQDQVEASIRTGVASGKPYSFEHRIVRPDGSVRHVLQRALARRAENGEMGTVGTVQDITERMEMLERLQQAQKMEAVGQLTGGIAHDFNNLLTVIIGNLDLLKETVEQNSDKIDLIDRGVRAAERGADLTHRLLAFSRRQTLLPVAVDLNMLISGMIEMLRRTLGETITISTREPADLWLCEADKSQLENALLNLAINARDAMPDRGKLLIENANVEFSEDEGGVLNIEPGCYVKLRIADTGSGIAAEMLNHVFEPFFTTKDVGKGSGLGLSMVYGFARQSGGVVMIDSALGKGTAVSLYLPRANDGTVRGAESLSHIEVLRGNEERILVVEDDRGVRDQTVNLLLSLGYRAYPVDSGQAALKQLAEMPSFDLLLSDVVLPDLNGPSLVEIARRQDPDIAVLYMTGYADGAFEHHAEENKSTGLINKPFTEAQLARSVHDALRRL